MAKLIFGGTELRYNDTRYEEETQSVFHRLHFKSDLKPNLAAEMKWDIFDEEHNLRSGLTSCSLTGSRSITSFMLIPNGMKDSAMELEAVEIGDFKLKVRSPNSGEESLPADISLSCVITSTQPMAGQTIEEFMRTVGHGSGQLKCTLTEDKQQTLPGVGSQGKKAREAEENAAEVIVSAEEKAASGPVLASKAEVDRATRKGAKVQ